MDKNMYNETEYQTRDLYLAAYLFATHQVEFLGVVGDPGQKMFVFSPKQKVMKMVSDYHNFQADLIQPKNLFSALRDVKDALFQGQNKEGGDR